ncbi:pyridoxamine 5'-phosphate oxidase family protein [Cryptosporangium minutisporangium]|uniref:pyridoxamine 5'-phosphate oxidase family protein n=1 Tax=Cryptosporangium minutisporangium TaxID=113569 RepID=UPI0031EAD5CC
MNSPSGDLTALARAIVDTNLYLTLGTADSAGTPWVSPVCFVADRYRDFYWVSKTDALHSRNVAVRPAVSIVIYDSTVPVYQGRAVYLQAVAVEVPAAELDAGVEVYNRPAAERGVTRLERSDVEGSAPYRLYRATATQHFTLDPNGRDLRVPVAPSA